MYYLEIIQIIGILMIAVEADNSTNSAISATDQVFLKIMDTIKNNTSAIIPMTPGYDYTFISFAVGVTILEIILLIASLVLHVISFVIIKNKQMLRI